MIVGGVDLGVRKIAISIWSNGLLQFVNHLELAKINRAQELRTIADWAWESLKVCDLVLVEEPLVGRSTRVSLQIAQTAGAVLAEMCTKKNDFVPVKTWKKDLIGNGNANKEMVSKWFSEEYPGYAALCGDNQDRIDAACIGLYGVRLAARSTQLAEL